MYNFFFNFLSQLFFYLVDKPYASVYVYILKCVRSCCMSFIFLQKLLVFYKLKQKYMKLKPFLTKKYFKSFLKLTFLYILTIELVIKTTV